MEQVPSKADFLSLEREMLALWEREDFFGELQRLVKGRPLYRVVDGPITANNPMGVHHAWGRALKDTFIRYAVMNGHDCKFQNGFDCQGLWVEVEVEKELGFAGKPDIEAFGLDRFAEACKARVEKFAGVITEQSKRLGQWMDWDNSYYTHTDQNIVGIWHFLKVCAENGWIYREGLSMPWCPRCGTSLSEHEMAGSHQEMTHLSIFGRVPLLSDRSRRLLIWTTTPWTLSANVAAAVHPDLDYIEVKSDDWDHTLILCEGAKKVLAGTGAKVVQRFKGADLVGERYETFHPDFEAQRGIEHRVVAWEMVDASEGSGIVHIAPGCGREDHELGQELGLEPVVPVDENGKFTARFGVLAGKSASEVAQEVADLLDASGKLLRAEPYTHPYPVCWRCKGELIFRLVEEWFIRCDEIRPRMKAAAQAVTWKPPFIGKRMDNWLDNMGDWCISRKRYWGLPLPFYPCESCGSFNVIGSLDELRERAIDPAAVDALPELHRPWIDDVQITCEGCPATLARTPEVGDCWLDAGIVPYSTVDYFTDQPTWERAYPIEWVCEMREQVRLWFYSMLFMGVAISDRSPYDEVLAYERVVGEDGTLFSKTGFMIRFDEAVERMGADAMRYLYCRQPVTSDVRFGYGAGEQASRKLSALWNIYAFFVTYARIDEPDPAADLVQSDLTVTDRWLLGRTARMLDVAKRAYEAHDTPGVLREVDAFLDEVSNWYVRVNRRRFWRSGAGADKAAAYGVLYRCLKATIGVLAPITPFLTEAIWQNAVRSLEPDAPRSVHHSAWPVADPAWIDDGLVERTAMVREAISLGLSLRERAAIRIRQPLPTLHVIGGGAAAAAIDEQRGAVLREVNVKTVNIAESSSGLNEPRLALDFRAAGPVLRKDVNAVKQLLAALDTDGHAALAAQYDAGDDAVTIDGYDTPVPRHVFVRQEVARAGIEVTEGSSIAVALDTRVDEALLREGFVRDLVRNIQVLRKDTGLDLTDRIELSLVTQADPLLAGIAEHRDVIAEEVLCLDLGGDPLANADGSATWQIGGHEVTATLRRRA